MDRVGDVLVSDRSWLRVLRFRIGATEQPWKFLFGMLYGAALAFFLLGLFASVSAWGFGVDLAPLWAWLTAGFFFSVLIGISE